MLPILQFGLDEVHHFQFLVDASDIDVVVWELRVVQLGVDLGYILVDVDEVADDGQDSLRILLGVVDVADQGV